jgi:hypothetical protein
MLEKVRALLTQAEGEADAGHEEAAETFTKKAEKLIAKYGIDAALANERGETREQVTKLVIHVENPYGPDKLNLLISIGVPLRCRIIKIYGGRMARGESKANVFGFPADLERLELLYTSLLLQSQRLMYRQAIPYWDNAAAYRRSWMHGFNVAVYRRLEAAEKGATEAAEAGTALVLADRTALVNTAAQGDFPNAKKSKSNRQLSGSGTGAGYQAGQTADLGGAKVTAGTRKELS